MRPIPTYSLPAQGQPLVIFSLFSISPRRSSYFSCLISWPFDFTFRLILPFVCFFVFFSPPFCLIYWRSAVSISFTHFRHAFLFYAHFCQYQPRSVTTTTTRTTRMYGGTKRGSRPGSGSPPPTAVLSLEPDFVATFPDEIITRLSFCSHRDSTLCFSVNCSFRPIETATRLIRGLQTNGADRVVRIKCLLRFCLKTVETRQHSTFLVRPLYAFRYDGSFYSLRSA